MHHSAQDLYDEARGLLAEHRPAEARARLLRAADTCDPDDAELALRIRISLAWLLFEEDGASAAGAELTTIAQAAEAADLAQVAAAAEVQHGLVRARAGDQSGAWRVLCRIDPGRLPPADRMRLHINRGTLASELHRFDDAAADLALAAALADELDQPMLAAMARHNLGWVEFLRGDLPAALRDMHDADSGGVAIDRSVARHDRARALLEAGLVAEAHELLLGARADAPSARDAAEIDLDLARSALLLGRADDALSYARAAARVFARRREPAWHRRALLAQVRARPRRATARGLRRAAAMAGDRLVAAQAAAAELLAPGPPQDRAELRREVAWLARSPVVSLRMAALVALATDSVRDGDRAGARRLLRRASTTLVRAQLGLASLDLRTATAVHGEAAAALDLQLAAGLGQAAVVETAERWRAATRPVARVGPTADPRTAETATRLRRLRAEFRPDLPDAAECSRRIVAAERELRGLTWGATAELPPSVETVAPAQLTAAAAAADASLVVTVRSGEDVVAVVLGRRHRTVRLGAAAEISELVDATRADLTARATLHPAHPLTAVVAASLAARLAELGALVADPLADLPGHLVIVPTRVLSGVAWGALPSLRGRAVTVAPTASSWATAGRVAHRPRVSVLTGPGLPFAADEADAISGCWPLVGSPTLAAALAADDLVHVAAHGEHRGDNPQFSSLLLADGPVFAHELEGVPVRAGHVVLSACEVGRATHRPGDQPLGLTATLLSAGVGCVVAPVAPVGDRLAAEVMGRYHAELCGGADAATALARATVDDPSAGAFVCFGAPWRATV